MHNIPINISALKIWWHQSWVSACNSSGLVGMRQQTQAGWHGRLEKRVYTFTTLLHHVLKAHDSHYPQAHLTTYPSPTKTHQTHQNHQTHCPLLTRDSLTFWVLHSCSMSSMYVIDWRRDKQRNKGLHWWIYLREVFSTTPKISSCPIVWAMHCEKERAEDEEASSKLSREISEMPRLNTWRVWKWQNDCSAEDSSRCLAPKTIPKTYHQT